MTAESLAILKQVYRPELTNLDLACLAWWARNRVAIEQELYADPRLMVLSYEHLVTTEDDALAAVFAFTGLRHDPGAARHIHARSVGLNPWPGADPDVERLCAGLQQQLDDVQSGERMQP